MEASEHFGTQRLDIVQKFFAPKFVDSSCKQYIIWEYALIPPDQNLSKPCDKIVLIFPVRNICNENI